MIHSLVGNSVIDGAKQDATTQVLIMSRLCKHRGMSEATRNKIIDQVERAVGDGTLNKLVAENKILQRLLTECAFDLLGDSGLALI